MSGAIGKPAGDGALVLGSVLVLVLVLLLLLVQVLGLAEEEAKNCGSLVLAAP